MGKRNGNPIKTVAPDTDTKPFNLRHEAGKARIAALIQYWLPKTQLSQDQVNAIVSWGLGQINGLESSKISQLRNERVQKPSLKDLDALATLNLVIHAWQVEGPEAARERWGPPSAYQVQEEWLDKAVWISDPRFPADPLLFSDICDIFAGYLNLPIPGIHASETSHATRMSDALGDMLDADLVRLGLPPRNAVERLLSCYPDQSATAEINKLRAVVMGDGSYSPTEFDAELVNLAETVRVLRGLPVGCYSPGELRDELSAGLRRHG